jgi:hypothetical protein
MKVMYCKQQRLNYSYFSLNLNGNIWHRPFFSVTAAISHYDRTLKEKKNDRVKLYASYVSNLLANTRQTGEQKMGEI